jgi:hypothetical protein
MNHKLSQLAAQRKSLINEATYQRIELAEAFESVSKPVKLIDQGLFAVRYLVKHPLLLASTLVLAGAVRPNRWLRMLESGLLVWRMAASVKRSLKED